MIGRHRIAQHRQDAHALEVRTRAAEFGSPWRGPIAHNGMRDTIMQVTVELPEDVARRFAGDASGLSRAALEALALEGVRSGKLSTAQARRLLGIRSRYEMDGFLKAHGILLPMTIEDVRSDSDTAIAFSK